MKSLRSLSIGFLGAILTLTLIGCFGCGSGGQVSLDLGVESGNGNEAKTNFGFKVDFARNTTVEENDIGQIEQPVTAKDTRLLALELEAEVKEVHVSFYRDGVLADGHSFLVNGDNLYNYQVAPGFYTLVEVIATNMHGITLFRGKLENININPVEQGQEGTLFVFNLYLIERIELHFQIENHG